MSGFLPGKKFLPFTKNFLVSAALLHNGGFFNGYIAKRCQNKSANGLYNYVFVPQLLYGEDKSYQQIYNLSYFE
jgi:hypothetical protein